MDMREINREIERLECGDTTYGACEKLSILYSVRDHAESAAPSVYSYAPEPQRQPQTEFEKAASAADWDQLMDVLNEHFDVIKALHPKEYSAVIRKIKSKA